MKTDLCAICGGHLELRTITHQQPSAIELFEFENVPAMVCAQCGESWLDAEVLERMEQVIRQQPEPKRFRQVPVYSLTDFPAGSL